MALIVHHLGISQSERIPWLCEELAIPYELKKYDRDQTGMAPADYKKLSPMGIAPVITDGDLVLGESGAIIDYLITKYGNGRLRVSPDNPDWPHYLFWFHFANATLMPAEVTRLFAGMIQDPAAKGMLTSFAATRADKAYAQLEAHLAKFPYTGGREFSASDIMMFFPMTTLRTHAPRDFASSPNIQSYLKRISARHAYQRTMAKGDAGMKLNLS
jgi:glutathione S-transferase